MSVEGWTLPGHRPEGVLGRGTSGVVHRAGTGGGEGAAAPGAVVAIKALLVDAGSLGEASVRARLGRLQEISRHPCVTDLLGAGVHAGRPYLVMPLREHATLAERLRSGPLPVSEAAAVIADVAAGLDHAHEHGVLHLNLHPGNVLRSDEGRWTVTDLGLATLVGVSATVDRAVAAGRTGWSPSRFAPELRAGRAFSAACDVHALAWMAHRLLNLDDPAVRVPRLVRDVIDRGLGPTASHRQRTAGGFAAELARAVGSGPMIGLADVADPARTAVSGPPREPSGQDSSAPLVRPPVQPSGWPSLPGLGLIPGVPSPGPVTQALALPPPARSRAGGPGRFAVAVSIGVLVLAFGLGVWVVAGI